MEYFDSVQLVYKVISDEDNDARENSTTKVFLLPTMKMKSTLFVRLIFVVSLSLLAKNLCNFFSVQSVISRKVESSFFQISTLWILW